VISLRREKKCGARFWRGVSGRPGRIAKTNGDLQALDEISKQTREDMRTHEEITAELNGRGAHLLTPSDQVWSVTGMGGVNDSGGTRAEDMRLLDPVAMDSQMDEPVLETGRQPPTMVVASRARRPEASSRTRGDSQVDGSSDVEPSHSPPHRRARHTHLRISQRLWLGLLPCRPPWHPAPPAPSTHPGAPTRSTTPTNLRASRTPTTRRRRRRTSLNLDCEDRRTIGVFWY
jgi:hypothetical protein